MISKKIEENFKIRLISYSSFQAMKCVLHILQGKICKPVLINLVRLKYQDFAEKVLKICNTNVKSLYS